MALDLGNPEVRELVKKLLLNSGQRIDDTIKRFKLASFPGMDADEVRRIAIQNNEAYLDEFLDSERIIDKTKRKEYKELVQNRLDDYFQKRDEGSLPRQRTQREQAARQARRQAPARQRQQLPAIPEQAAPRRAAAAAQTVREPIVRVGVRDLPENLRPLAETLEEANRQFDTRQNVVDEVMRQEGRLVGNEQQLLDEAIQERNTAQAALEEAIDRDIPEGDRPRVKQGLRNNRILRMAGKGIAGMAAVSEGLKLLADKPKEVKQAYKETKEAVKSPLRTAKEFGKEAADFYRIMTGSGKSAKAIKKKIGKDVKAADKAAYDFLLKTVLSPEQIEEIKNPKGPQA